MEYKYWIAGGNSLEAVRSIQADRKAGYKARLDYAKSLGAVGMYGSDSSFGCFYFKDGTAPPGWRKSTRVDRDEEKLADAYVPDKRLKAGKAIGKQIYGNKTYHIPDGMDFSSRIGFNVFIREMAMHYASFETVGEVVVLHVPIDPEKPAFVPPDAAPLKTSEYWALKEAQPVRQSA